MPIEPVKIPQNVYVEDRIIGPITLRQVMIVMISAGISYAIWAGMKSAGTVNATQTTIAWMPTVIGAVFAFVKINGISLFRMMLLLIERLDKPARRVWMPRKGIYVNIITKAPKAKKEKQEVVQKQRSGIEELSELLDQGPTEPKTKPKPVVPDRIQAEKRKKPVDDIAEKTQDTRPSAGGLLRDIAPPPSHA